VPYFLCVTFRQRTLSTTRCDGSFCECGHVRGYPSELAQVWVNLLDNAADAVNGGGKITIQTASAARRLTAVPVSYDELLALLCVVRTTKGVGSGEGEGSGLRMRA
jgi:signal transduction histidine kinase